MLNEGDLAPDFDLMIDDGSRIVLSEQQGAPVIIYFYPKDDTSGCTTEALDFTKLLPQFKKLKARIVGISPDSVQKHVKFIAKHDLGITLAADEDKSAAMNYDVWAEKKCMDEPIWGLSARPS